MGVSFGYTRTGSVSGLAIRVEEKWRHEKLVDTQVQASRYQRDGMDDGRGLATERVGWTTKWRMSTRVHSSIASEWPDGDWPSFNLLLLLLFLGKTNSEKRGKRGQVLYIFTLPGWSQIPYGAFTLSFSSTDPPAHTQDCAVCTSV